MTLDESKFQASKWISRLELAEKQYKKWSDQFQCEKLNEYYEGKQWADIASYTPYTINLFYSTIQVKRPALLFKRPQYQVSSMPLVENADLASAIGINQNRQDVLNTIVSRKSVKFAKNVEMALLDSFFYFGIAEVGYSADWIMNPNAIKPELTEDYEENVIQGEGKTERENIPLPENERIYVKRIPAHRFRVAAYSGWDTQEVDWCGYYEFIRASDLKSKDTGFKFTDEITLVPGDNQGVEYDEDEKDINQRGDRLRVWKLWDLRQHKLNIVSPVGGVVIFQKSFNRLPLFPLRFAYRRHSWYPVPVSSNWKCPQDEYNESREQLRTMRRRSKRVWQTRPNTMEEPEKQKLIVGEDGTLVETSFPIEPVLNSPIDSSITNAMQVSKDEFNIVSGTTSEARGETDKTTATQASITNTRSQIRETHEREVVGEWLCEIGAEIIQLASEVLTNPMWVRSPRPSNANFGEDYSEIQETFRQVDPMQDLGSDQDEVEVTLNVESLSPLINDNLKKDFLEFLAVLNQYPQLGMNPDLIREAAYRMNYRNEKVIAAFQQMAQLQMIGMIEQGKQALMAMGGESNVAQQTAEAATPPTQAEIELQMSRQGVPQ